jgi:hypothetical protein
MVWLYYSNVAVGMSIGFEVCHPPNLNESIFISLTNLRLEILSEKPRNDYFLKFSSHFSDTLSTPPFPLPSQSERRSSSVDQKRASQRKEAVVRVNIFWRSIY